MACIKLDKFVINREPLPELEVTLLINAHLVSQKYIFFAAAAVRTICKNIFMF